MFWQSEDPLSSLPNSVSFGEWKDLHNENKDAASLSFFFTVTLITDKFVCTSFKISLTEKNWNISLQISFFLK